MIIKSSYREHTDNSTAEEMQEFVSEATVMVYFDHPNVMTLIGACINPDDGLPMIVLPYMANGDLKYFLISNRREDSVEVFPEVCSVNIIYDK